MTDAGFFRGTSAEQDNRFSDKQKKLLKQLKFSENLNHKVDLTKVNLDALKPWISKRLEEILMMDDDVVVDFVINQLTENKFPDGKLLQINLTGFLNGKMAREFMGELWDHLLEAQASPDGIPPKLAELKKQEANKKSTSPNKVEEIIKKITPPVADNSPTSHRSGPNKSRSPSPSSKLNKSPRKDDSAPTEPNLQSKRFYRVREDGDKNGSPDPSDRQRESRKRRASSGSNVSDKSRHSRSKSPRYQNQDLNLGLGLNHALGPFHIVKADLEVNQVHVQVLDHLSNVDDHPKVIMKRKRRRNIKRIRKTRNTKSISAVLKRRILHRIQNEDQTKMEIND
uniref:PWI domain-containing protein n=1 Tax=Tetranychus urticae TaxID=32264 RepID=T1JQ43_TETUR